MAMPALPELIDAIRHIRPDLAADQITAQSRIGADLTLDSLDMIELAVTLRKRHQVALDVEGWSYDRAPLSDLTEHLTEL